MANHYHYLCNMLHHPGQTQPITREFPLSPYTSWDPCRVHFGLTTLTRVRDRPGKTQQTGIFCGKTLLLTSSGARVQESKSSIAYIFRSQSARVQECKRARARARVQEREWRNPVPFKNYPLPRTCYSLIGCSPSAELSSRGRQSTWGGELPLAHAQIICLPLRTQDVSAILQRRMWGRLPTHHFWLSYINGVKTVFVICDWILSFSLTSVMFIRAVSMGRVILCCMHVPCFVDSFIHQWAPGLLPGFNCCEWCCHELGSHKGLFRALLSVLWVDAQKQIGIRLYFYFSFWVIFVYYCCVSGCTVSAMALMWRPKNNS
jgi:hypothetical protein